MSPVLKSVLLSILLAVAVTGFQVLVKYLSRPDPPVPQAQPGQAPVKPPHRLRLEDFVWWHEWVVLATVGILTVTIKNAVEEKANSVELAVAVPFVIACWVFLFPIAVRKRFCQPTGEYKNWVYVTVANLIGAGCIAAAVSVGVRLYG